MSLILVFNWYIYDPSVSLHFGLELNVNIFLFLSTKKSADIIMISSGSSDRDSISSIRIIAQVFTTGRLCRSRVSPSSGFAAPPLTNERSIFTSVF